MARRDCPCGDPNCIYNVRNFRQDTRPLDVRLLDRVVETLCEEGWRVDLEGAVDQVSIKDAEGKVRLILPREVYYQLRMT